ncbi:DUF4136 domain-containing protein [Aquimarina agarivorans]|uniref:DUF4136 domain-containing protein n=1 Tax=Aquimarina agarivorans TaxID=980584 RepID=UPI000248F317|nr:DUF4136 domain-containing protein [Aquimarina agarivorans]
MKAGIILSIICGLLITSCSTVRVVTDYDTKATFTQYKTFAYFKPGVDKVEISDLDKRRILRSIDAVMQSRGLKKSDTPDILVNISTEAEKNTYLYPNNFGFGFGWSPFWWGNNFANTYDVIEGTLFIDLIDANKKELIWQGIGSAPIVQQGPEEKEERIYEIVSSILAKYPPVLKQ